jgi:hypothetical protein
VVANAVDRLDAKIEWFKNDVGAPDCMVIAARDECIEGVLAGMASRSMSTVVSEGNGLGESNIEPERTSDGCGYLCDLEGVGEPSSLVVIGEDEYLGLASKTAKRR